MVTKYKKLEDVSAMEVTKTKTVTERISIGQINNQIAIHSQNLAYWEDLKKEYDKL